MMHVFDQVPVDRLTASINHGPRHLQPVIEAVRDYGCAFAIVCQHAGCFKISNDKPTILVIGDDMHEALGPSAFHRKSLRKYITTCRGAVVVPCEPHPTLYEAAASVAVVERANAVLIETRIEREQEWVDFLRSLNPEIHLFLGTLEPAGGVH